MWSDSSASLYSVELGQRVSVCSRAPLRDSLAVTHQSSPGTGLPSSSLLVFVVSALESPSYSKEIFYVLRGKKKVRTRNRWLVPSYESAMVLMPTV